MRLAVTTLILAGLATPALAAAPVSGRWLTDDGKGIVEIGACGESVCGRIIRVLADTGGATTDSNNPDPTLRSRPLIGLNILSGFKDSGKIWEGKIYSPERGQTYRSELIRQANGTLQVKGCVGPFCQTKVWKPVK